MKDWVVRSIKTFIQAFFGTLIPAVCALLNNGWPESINAAWVILAPTVAAALAAAICAVWNIVLEYLDKEDKPPAVESEQTGKHEIPTDRGWDGKL